MKMNITNQLSLIWKYGKSVTIPLIWYSLGYCDKENLKKNAYKSGYNISQYMKKYPTWDKYAEPFFIQQFSIIVSTGYSFIEGMISDNEDKITIGKNIIIMRKEIIDDLNHKE